MGQIWLIVSGWVIHATTAAKKQSAAQMPRDPLEGTRCGSHTSRFGDRLERRGRTLAKLAVQAYAAKRMDIDGRRDSAERGDCDETAGACD